MKKEDLKAITDRASAWHNAHPIEERRVLCIASMSQQITTLQSMKQKIQRAADTQCREIDAWITNIARDLKTSLDDRAALATPTEPAKQPAMPKCGTCETCGAEVGITGNRFCRDHAPHLVSPPQPAPKERQAKCGCDSGTAICGKAFSTGKFSRSWLVCMNPVNGSICGHPRACHQNPESSHE